MEKKGCPNPKDFGAHFLNKNLDKIYLLHHYTPAKNPPKKAVLKIDCLHLLKPHYANPITPHGSQSFDGQAFISCLPDKTKA